MQPMLLDATGWAMISVIIGKLTVFVVLMIIGAFSILLSRAVVPSLVATFTLADQYLGYRRALVVVAVIAFVLAIVQFVWIVVSVVAFLQPFYPRFGF